MPIFSVDAYLHIVADDIEADDIDSAEDAFLKEFNGWPGELMNVHSTIEER